MPPSLVPGLLGHEGFQSMQIEAAEVERHRLVSARVAVLVLDLLVDGGKNGGVDHFRPALSLVNDRG